MAKRRTIGNDPLTSAPDGEIYSAEIVPMPMTPSIAKENIAPPPPPVTPRATPEPSPIVVVDGRGQRSVGGRLEILGGDLGIGSRAIWPLAGEGGGVGFVAPTGRSVDLGQELDTVQAWADKSPLEHRYLSAIGWAWVVASVGGIAGLFAAGGLRLLAPKRMMVTMALSDGSKIVARTDSVTAVRVGGVRRRKAWPQRQAQRGVD